MVNVVRQWIGRPARAPGFRYLPARGAALGLPVASLLMLAGCAAGPDFQKPPAPAADSYVTPASVAGSPRLAVGADIEHDWFRIFGSSVTDELIRRALAASPTLEEAQARVTQAREQLRAQHGALLPSVDASLGASRSQGNGAVLGISSPAYRSTFGLYSTELSASYDLDLAGANRRTVESAAAKLDAANAQYQSAYITLEANVVSSAITAAALNDKIAATQAMVDADNRRLAIYEAQVQAGSIAGQAVLQLRSQMASTRATLAPLQQQLAMTRSTLATLLGEPVGEFQLPPLSLKDFRLPPEVPVSVPSELARQRPDVLLAEANLHDATAQLGMATANLYPRVTLSASYGTSTNTASDIFKPGSVIWSLGAGLTQPIFEGGRLRAQRDAAKAALDASAADYRNTVLSAFADVSNTLQALQNDATAIHDQDEALAAAQGAMGVVDAQVRHGSAAHFDLLTSQSQLQLTRIANIDAHSQQFLDVVGLYRSLGGGWWSGAPGDLAAAPPTAPAPAQTR